MNQDIESQYAAGVIVHECVGVVIEKDMDTVCTFAKQKFYLSSYA
jgi:hypothetical protein